MNNSSIPHPDYKSWLSQNGLSPHELGCLYVGVEPTSAKLSLSDTLGASPSIPANLFGGVDPLDWERGYQRVYLSLRRGIQMGHLDIVAPPDFVRPGDALEHLRALASTAGWQDALIKSDLYKAHGEYAARRNDSDQARIVELENEVAAVRRELTQLLQVSGYSTPMLAIATRMIAKHYAGKPPGEYPKQEVLFNDLRSITLSDGTKLSQKKQEAIWAVISHPSQSAGGPRGLRNR